MNPNEIEEDEIDLREIILHLKRNLKSILFITLLVALGAAAYAYFLPPIYSSSVSIAFSDEKSSKLASIIPDELAGFKTDESQLETVKLTLETRKFINSVIKDMNISQHYFLEENFRKNEVYGFDNLEIHLNINDAKYYELAADDLYGEYFEIDPIDETTFTLKIDKLQYSKVHHYDEEIKELFFTLKVQKIKKLEHQAYFFTKSNPILLADNILENMEVSILSDNVMKIAYKNAVAKRSEVMVTAIGKAFIAYTLDKRTSELSQMLTFLDGQLIETKLQLNHEGDKLKSYQQKSDSFISVETGNSIFESIINKEEELKHLELQARELANFRKALNENQFNTIALLNSGINSSSIQSLVEGFGKNELELNTMQLQAQNIEKSITSNTQLSALIQNLNNQHKLLDELRFNFTEGHPQVVKAAADLSKIENDIRGLISANIERLEQSQSLTKQKIVNNIVMTQRNVGQKLKVLKADLTQKNTLLQSLPEKDLDIQELKQNFTLSENIYTFLLQKKMEMQISKASTIANTKIIEDAREALKPIKPNKKLIVIVGLIMGLILGIFFTFIRAMLDSKIRDASMVESLTDAPLYGVLPLKHENKRFFDEALRSIRTNLQFVPRGENKCMTMLISSTIPGEGKTTVIAGLANVVAQTGKKVLIMDLDLRKPRLYQELGKSNKVGMTHYLVGDINLSDVIQPISDNLDFFAAGTVPPNPSELLMSEKFDKTMNELMEQYDYILFDTAPIGSVIDANMLLKYTDILLLVIRAYVAEKSFLENFNRLRKEKNITSSGVILNQVKVAKVDGYGYGYGYGYGDTQHKDA